MEKAPLKPPAGSTEKSPTQKNTFQDVMIFLYGESITEEAYKKGMEQQQTGDDPGEWEYIDSPGEYPDGTPARCYYKVPRMSKDDLKLRIAARTCKATEEAAKHTQQIKYIIIALVILGIIGGMILNQSISNLF